jgi:hypothetical protein
MAGVGADALVGAGVAGAALGILGLHAALHGHYLPALALPSWGPLAGAVAVTIAVLGVGLLAWDLLAWLLAADRGVSALFRVGALVLAAAAAARGASSDDPRGAAFAGMLLLLGLLACVLGVLLAVLGWARRQVAAHRSTLAIRARVRTLEPQ